MISLNSPFLRELSAQAAASPRRRKNHNLHASSTDVIQRMLNAFEPKTYVRPHRHKDKWELFVILSGQVSVLTFDDRGCVRERIDLDLVHGARVLEIEQNTWHTVVSHAPGTVLFEVKPGPYVPTAPDDFAVWAPSENETTALTAQEWFRTAVAGDVVPDWK